MQITDVIVVGGGLAGLTAALDLAQRGHDVTVLERKQYPQHRVCGEYVSNEVRPYFQRLEIPISTWPTPTVGRFRLHAPSGRWVESALPLGGFGLRRYALDKQLYELARARGVHFELETTVSEVGLDGDCMELTSRDGRTWRARTVIGAHGKRSTLDQKLDRRFVRSPSPVFAGKFYVEGDFPGDLVALYTFPGGYAGAVRVEDGTVDIAYLADQQDVRRLGGPEAVERKRLRANPALSRLLDSSTRVPDTSFSIANVSLLPKEQVVRNVLMVGDAAGMIPPVCGNGMAMAVHGAKLAAESVGEFLAGRTDRNQMEDRFAGTWRRQFRHRLQWGRILHPVLRRPAAAEAAVRGLNVLPRLLRPLIRQTHGNAIA